jgi:hypothetical protein
MPRSGRGGGARVSLWGGGRDLDPDQTRRASQASEGCGSVSPYFRLHQSLNRRMRPGGLELRLRCYRPHAEGIDELGSAADGGADVGLKARTEGQPVRNIAGEQKIDVPLGTQEASAQDMHCSRVISPEDNHNVNTAIATLETNQPLDWDELEALRQALAQHWAVSERVVIDGVATIQLTLSGDKRIDLSSVPAGKVAHLRVQVPPRTRALTIANLGPDSVVAITILDLPSNQHIETLKIDDCRGQVRVVSTVEGVRLVCTQPPPVEGCVEEVPPEEARSVVLESDAGLTVEESLTGTVLLLNGGTVWVGADIEHIAVVSGGLIDRAVGRGGRIRELMVAREVELAVGPDMPTIEKIVGSTQHVSPKMHRAVLALRLVAGVGQTSAEVLPVDEIRNVTIVVKSSPATLVRVKTVNQTEICGGLRLSLRDHATVAQSSFTVVPGTTGDIGPVLTSAPNAFLLDVSGTVSLGEVPGIHIASGKSGLAIDLDPSVDSASDPWKGAMMTNVILPKGLVGRQVLDRLDSTYQFTPAVTDLPGRDQTVIAWAFRKRKAKYAKDSTSQRLLYEDAEFMRELAALCREKGTPGSVATTVAWCAYRLRTLKAHGVEKVALSVYRALGYGERPLPAFLLWAVLALGLAGPVLALRGADFDWSGYNYFLTEAGRLALGPLAGLLKGGTLDGGDIVEVAARALTSVPLVTGSLAMRNYVKSER